MGVKSPPKNFSIKKLSEIKENYYSHKGIDYAPDEVDKLLWQKQQKIVPRVPRDTRESIRSRGSKPCTSCRQFKKLEEFHVDRKKLSGRRSHCKICRRRVPF